MESELKPITEILVPIDFSDSCLRALRFAMRFAAASNAHLHLLHVVDSPTLIHHSVDQEFRDKHAEKMAKKFLEVTTPEEREQFRASMVIRFGTAYHEIETYAKEQNIEMIVMGNTPRSAISDAILGSVTKHILRHASCPVLTVTGSRDS